MIHTILLLKMKRQPIKEKEEKKQQHSFLINKENHFNI